MRSTKITRGQSGRGATFEALEGRQMFAAVAPRAVPAGSAKLAGTVMGTAGSYQGKGNTVANVFDANVNTFFDAPAGSGAAWAGLDLGTADRITQFQFVPRSGYASRTLGGVVQGSSTPDFAAAITLAAVTATPAGGKYTALAVTDPSAYRYVRYLAPATGSGNVAEVEFDGVSIPTAAPDAPVQPSATASATAVVLSWSAGSAVPVDTYTVQRQGPTDATFVTVGTSASMTFVDATAGAGVTYVYQVVAGNVIGSSAASLAVTVTVPVPVANPWSDADVGSPGKAGSSTLNADGTVTVVGGGADIWNGTDQFHLTSQPLVGNGSVVTQVVSQGNTNGWAKGGVMVRESANADSRFVLLAVTPGNGVTWQARAGTHTTPTSKTVAGKAGVWLRIDRAGSTFTGLMSGDGVTWTVVGTATITMVNNVLGGLAVTAHDNAKASAVVFANTTVTATGTAASAWSAAAAGPMTRWESETFTYNNRLYVFGGFIDRNLDATAECDVYDPAANAWSVVGTVPIGPLTHAAVTVVGDTAYFAGGNVGTFSVSHGGAATPAVLTFNLMTGTWGSTTSLPAAMSCGGLVCINNTLYYYGGLNATNTVDQTGTYALDLSNPSAGWAAKAALPLGRNHLGAAAINGVAYAVGGWHLYDTIHGNVAEVDAYDPVADQWTKVASLPTTLGSIETSTMTADGKIVVVGGGTNGGYDGVYQSTVLVYDPATNTWSQPVTLPEANEGMSVAYVNGQLIVAQGTVDNQGGWSQNAVYVTTVAI